MLTIVAQDQSGYPVPNGNVWAVIAIYLAVWLAFYALRSVGLFVLAKRQNVSKAYLAFIPCVWIYTVCKLIGNQRFLGKTTYEKLALIVCIVFAVAQVSSLVYNFIIYFPLAGNFLMGRNIYIYEQTPLDVALIPYWAGENVFVDAQFVYPYGNNGDYPSHLIPLLNCLYYVSSAVELVMTVATIFIYLSLFRKFWPQHYILAAVLSIMGIFAPFVFAIRKKEPIEYSDYLRSRYVYYNPYGGPYGGQYGRPNANQTPPSHPFEEFAERGEVDPGNPFEEFDDDKKE